MSTYSLQDAIAALEQRGCQPTSHGNDAYTAYCPVHEANDRGHKPSLSIKAGDQQPFVVYCHAGCSARQIMDALGLTPTPTAKTPRKRVATYDYHDAEGRLVSQKIRYEPKDFRQRWPDGAGGWNWKKADCATSPPNVLYRLPKLLEAKVAGHPVFVVEGEKDADRLFASGLSVSGIVATTTIEGASKNTQRPKWKAEYTEQLAGAARVVLIPDNDAPGRAHMVHVARQLKGKVSKIHWLELPGLPAKGDVSDWLNQGHTVAELLELADAAPDAETLVENETVRAQRDNNYASHPALASFPVEVQLVTCVTPDNQSVTCVTVPLLEVPDEKGRPVLIESEVAARLANALRDTFAYCADTKTWHVFGRCHWQANAGTRLIHAVAQMLYVGAPNGFKARQLSAIVTLLEAGLLSLPPRATSAGRHIPFINGLLDQETRKLAPITPDNALTWCLPYAYDPTATCPTVRAWLRQAGSAEDGELDDDPDAVVEFLRAWFAALLTGRADLQRFLHLMGPGGTGKGAFIRLAEALVGTQNATVTDLKNLETNRFETAALHGKRLAAITDSGRYGGSIDVFKALTGQDPLRMEVKHRQQGATFFFDGMALLASNEPLQFSDYTGAIERRRLTVEFSRRVSDAERADWDARGGETAVLHAEIPGVVNWALALTRDEVTRLLRDQPPQVLRGNREAMRHSNPVADWLLENTVPDPACTLLLGGFQEITISKRVSDSETETRKVIEQADSCAYPNYRAWCLKNHRAPVAARRFSGLVLDLARTLKADVYKVKRNDGRYIAGLRLRRPEDDGREFWAISQGSPQKVTQVPQRKPTVTQGSGCILRENDASAENDGKQQTFLSYARVREEEKRRTPDRAPHPSAALSARILTVLHGIPGGLAPEELLRQVGNEKGASPTLIELTLTRLVKQGDITKVNGRWTLLDAIRPGTPPTAAKTADNTERF